VLFIVEDLHWIDPSTLELLTLFIDQEPTARILTLFTARPDFHPPWGIGEHVASLTLERLPPTQVEQMIDWMTGGKRLPAEVHQQVVTQTDGVPLFVEELTKTVLESGMLREEADHYELVSPLPSFTIPTTLHDSLMARLDRLGDAKEVAQLGATLGRIFPYELLRAVSPWDEERLQHPLTQLVEAELLYQRGAPPHVTYVFKHTLIQETAYQSLLKRKRQQYHQQTVRILEQRFPEITETQPELLAHHYTEAGLPAQALPYWQRAGQLAVERSANYEAISHLTKGLEVLQSLPESPERVQHELAIHLTLGAPLWTLKGHAALEVEEAYNRTLTLCQQVGDTPQRFSVSVGLWRFYLARARLQKARELAEQCATLALHLREPVFLLEAHLMQGSTLFYLGDLASAHTHLEQGIALYTPRQGSARVFSRATDPEVDCLCRSSWVLCLLGYPDQALARSHEALVLAEKLSHAHSQAFASFYAGVLRQFRREPQAVLEQAAVTIALSQEWGFGQWLTGGMILRDWAQAEYRPTEDNIAQLRRSLANWHATGVELGNSRLFAMLAGVYAKAVQAEAGLSVLTEALTLVHKNEEHYYDAELHRLRGELLLLKTIPDEWEAESSFQRALDIARRQRAKLLELRAAMCLSLLWQQQGKREEARQVLTESYGWFLEGFKTPDLQEANALLDTFQ
jgi:predicted ATPase